VYVRFYVKWVREVGVPVVYNFKYCGLTRVERAYVDVT
jgi:hypothetical protein